MFLAKINAEFDRAARAAERGLPDNRFAAIRNGRLKLKRRDAVPISRVLQQLRATIELGIEAIMETPPKR